MIAKKSPRFFATEKRVQYTLRAYLTDAEHEQFRRLTIRHGSRSKAISHLLELAREATAQKEAS